MAEPTQFEFSLKDITVNLIKQAGIHEGLWMAGFEFGFGAMHIGPSPTDARPAAFVQVNKIILSKVPEGTPEGSPLIVDAAAVNPAPAGGRPRRSKKPASIAAL